MSLPERVVPLFRLFILRQIARERLRSGLTILGIALGIGVVIAIQLTNRSSIRGFESAVSAMAGRTSLEIVGTGLGFDERRFVQLEWLREFGEVSPVIEGTVRAVSPDGRRESLQLLGVDILRDRPLREYRMQGAGSEAPEARPTAQGFLDLLLDPRSVILTDRYARRHGVRVGSQVELTATDEPQRFFVRALLDDEGPARLLDGGFALMDIAAAQTLLDRIGYLDRLDLRLRPGLDPASARQDIAARLPDDLLVRTPDDRTGEVERMLAAFHANLTALSYIALLVGLFLIYNTVSTSVIARREEIGTLRALGASRRRILGLFLGEAAVLALVGCAIGVGLGQVLAEGAVRLTSTTVRVLFVASAAAPPGVDLEHVALGFAVGMPLALLAAWVPSLEAARVPPQAAQRGADRLETRYRLRVGYLAAPLAFFGLAFWLSRQDAVAGLPLFGYGAALATVFGAAFMVPATLYWLSRLARLVLARMFTVEAWLANSSVGGAIPRLSISVAALAVSLSLTIAIAIMVSSFRDTVIYWVEQTFRADLFVAPETRRSGSRRATLSPEVEAIVAAHPDVEAVDRFRTVDVPYADRLVTILSGEFGVALEHGDLLFKAPADGRAAMLAAIGRDAVLASEAFAVRYRKAPGDTVTIRTMSGPAPFQIAAVYYDYSSDQGILAMDGATFRRHFADPRAAGLTVYLRNGADPDAVRAHVVTALEGRFDVAVRTNRTLRTELLQVFDSTFAITYALELVAIAVAILGVIATLLTLILERRRELTVLRLLGADRAQVRRMIMIEAALIGSASQAIGIAVGVLLSWVLIYVINLQSFGWTIRFQFPVLFVLQASGLVIATTVIAGLYPAYRAARLEPGTAMAEE